MNIELRDWLAQNATNEDLKPYLGRIGNGSYLPYRYEPGLRELARYEYADAMLKARDEIKRREAMQGKSQKPNERTNAAAPKGVI